MYPLLSRLYPALHGALIWWAWQACSLLPVQKHCGGMHPPQDPPPVILGLRKTRMYVSDGAYRHPSEYVTLCLSHVHGGNLGG